MSRILNEGFETWTHGTDFLPLSVDGTQLADDWYYSREGTNGGTLRVLRNVNGEHTGSYSLELFQIIAGASGTQRVYQDYAGYAALASQTVTFSIWAFGGGDFTMTVDDGVAPTTQTKTSTGSYAQFTVTHTMNVSPTKLRVSVAIPSDVSRSVDFDDADLIVAYVSALGDSTSPGSGLTLAETNFYTVTLGSTVSLDEAFNVVSDWIDVADAITLEEVLAIRKNRQLTLSLSDNLDTADALDTYMSGKGPRETVILQDWLQVKKSDPQAIWGGN